MQQANATEWMTSLEIAAREILAGRPELDKRAFHRPKSTLCPKHGDCVQVVFAQVLQHVPWRTTHPVKFAETLLAMILLKVSHTNECPVFAGGTQAEPQRIAPTRRGSEQPGT